MMAKPYGRNKVQENEDGKSLLGGGCKTCPVVACATMTYRGSACASQRASHGLGDPMTNGDRIRAMTDEELADLLTNYSSNRGWITEIGRKICFEQTINWLKQPCEVEE